MRDRVQRWALVRTGDLDEAEDVTQEVLLRMDRYLETFDGRARFTTWLYRVTANTAASRRRRRVRERAVGGAGALREGETSGTGLPTTIARERAASADPALAALDRIESKRLAALVRHFFEELPARQREVFDLADLQGHAPAEVAEMLELHPGTVRTHLHRARRTIRKRMLEVHPELEDRVR